jgi:hypothetical protein
MERKPLNKVAAEIQSIVKQGKPVIVTLNRKPISVILSKGDYDQLTTPGISIDASARTVTLKIISAGTVVAAIDLFNNGEVIDPIMAVVTLGLFFILTWTHGYLREVYQWLVQDGKR